MRVVLDTNVIGSGLLARHGNEGRVLNLAFGTLFTLLISPDVLAEYRLVLPRRELKLRPQEVASTLANVIRVAESVQPTETISVCRDEDDNRFLECADAGKAHYLVTGNKRHFPTSWRGTRVVNAREFLELFAPTERAK